MKLTEIQVDRGVVIDLDGANATDLSFVAQSLLDQCSLIEYQISMQKAIEAEQGIAYDRIWMTKAEFSLRLKQTQVQLTKDLLAILQREEDVRYQRAFLRLCKAKLAPDEFAALVAQAKAESHDELAKLPSSFLATFEKYRVNRMAYQKSSSSTN